jgi:two-component sensor histidine kinase
MAIVANIQAAAWLGEDVGNYAALGVRSQMKVPLIEQRRLVGIVFIHDNEARAWTREEESFVQTVADRVYAAVAKIEAEQRQQMLNEELSHRLKNTLSLVQAIASQTLRDAIDEEALSSFRERLVALSKAHDILLQKSWSSASLGAVAHGVLSLQANPARLKLTGPDVALGPKAVLSLSMLLHELATNAVKYGALSAPTGSIELVWEVDRTGQQPVLVLKWNESGGPPARPPQKQGMGSRLIRLGLVGTGTSVVRYDHAGFSGEFRAPFSLVTEN